MPATASYEAVISFAFLLETCAGILDMERPARASYACPALGTTNLPQRLARDECLYTSGGDCACTLVIDHNDAFRVDCAFRHLESRRTHAIGKQSCSTAQYDRKYLQPKRIDQIMHEQRLNEICASINVQIRPFLLLKFG